MFLRLALDRDDHLMGLSAYLDGEVMTTRHLRVELADDLFELLRSFAREPGHDTAVVAAALTERLAAIDLSPLLADRTHRTAVLLPSSSVARLPLAALGPPGTRLLDRVESLIWLPNLFPLRAPPSTRPSRTGACVFAPGERGGTRWHAVAIGEPLTGERHFLGEDATLEAVLAQAPGAAVTTFYAHGSYVDGEQVATKDRVPGPSIELADDDVLGLSSLAYQWDGVQRVELWGCETGVNVPMDPMAVLVDDAFGFDYEFLRVGATSAIGSLYKVLEVVAAVEVARYRARIREGASAAVALADAQRTWFERDLPHVLELLRAHPTDGFARLAAEHGVTLPERAVRGGDPAAYETILSCPVVWASFRHVGRPGTS